MAGCALLLVFTAPLAIPATPLQAASTPVTTISGEPSGSLQLAPNDPATLLVTSADGSQSSHSLASHGTESHAGRTADVYTADAAPATTEEPAKVSTDVLAQLNGGRMPVGISSSSNPGPFAADWSHKGTITVWAANGSIIDAVNTQGATLTLSGGGLSASRTIVVADDGGWLVPANHVAATVAELAIFESATAENVLWSRYLPAVLAIAAVMLFVAARRTRRQLPALIATP